MERAAVKLAALLSLLLVVAGCTSFAHPLVGSTDIPFDRRLVGQWDADFEADGKVHLVIRRNGRVETTTEEPDFAPEKDSFRVRTARVDGFEVANVALKEHGKTFWQAMRYEVTDSGELRVFQCNDQTWFDAVSRGELGGKADRSQHGLSTFVTASSQELLSFVRSHHESAFSDEPLVLRKAR
jgi:hypothetical protein